MKNCKKVNFKQLGLNSAYRKLEEQEEEKKHLYCKLKEIQNTITTSSSNNCNQNLNTKIVNQSKPDNVDSVQVIEENHDEIISSKLKLIKI